MNRITDYGKLATDISNWIKQYTIDNNIKSLVVGVSGGIDSAVVSTLCCMTGLRTYPTIIDIESSKESLDIAERHCQWLRDRWGNSGSWYFKLTSTFNQYKKDIGNLQYDNHGMASAKSRMRMMVLYQQTYSDKGIVVGTGNKVEDFGVGFFTVGGDGCVSISPIADMYKTEVRALGRHLGISEEICSAPSVDGLWSDNRTDESVLGCTYEELEWAMEQLADIEFTTIDDIVPFKNVDMSGFTPRQSEVMLRYLELNGKNQHKMQPIPIYKLNQ